MELAFYAVLFSAAVLVMIVPQQLALVPKRLELNLLEKGYRSSLRSDVVATLPSYAVALPSFVALTAGGFHFVDGTTASVMVLSAAAWVVASPYQDHLRMSFHIAGMHWAAGVMSGWMAVMLGVGFLTVSWGAEVGGSYIPFCALAAANLSSIMVGLFLRRNLVSSRLAPARGLVGGFKYLASDLVQQFYAYLANIIVAVMLGATALATLEATRIAAQPVFVVGSALSSYFLPVAIRALAKGAIDQTYRALRRMAVGVVGAGLVYSVAIFAASPVLSYLAGRAVDAPLSAARASGNSVVSATAAFNQIYFVSGRAWNLLRNTVVAAVVAIASLAALAPLVGLFAVPISAVVVAVIRSVFIRRDIRRGTFQRRDF